MNEVITKLNEIEQKADTILRDAKTKKEQMLVRLERDKREIDAEYDRREAEAIKQLGEQLWAEAETQLAGLRQRNTEAEEALEQRYEKQHEQLAEEIVLRMIR